MSKSTKSVSVSGAASSVVVEGLAEAMSKTDKAAKLKALKAASKGREATERKNAKRQAKMADLFAGTNESGDNAKLRHNPQLILESLRPATDGELINGLEAKGWVIAICCETCDTERLINTQDAFQVRFCVEHKGEAQKAASKARRTAKRDAEIDAMSEDDLDAEIAALEAQAA